MIAVLIKRNSKQLRNVRTKNENDIAVAVEGGDPIADAVSAAE